MDALKSFSLATGLAGILSVGSCINGMKKSEDFSGEVEGKYVVFVPGKDLTRFAIKQEDGSWKRYYDGKIGEKIDGKDYGKSDGKIDICYGCGKTSPNSLSEAQKEFDYYLNKIKEIQSNQ